jgi:hypothetical protein
MPLDCGNYTNTHLFPPYLCGGRIHPCPTDDRISNWLNLTKERDSETIRVWNLFAQLGQPSWTSAITIRKSPICCLFQLGLRIRICRTDQSEDPNLDRPVTWSSHTAKPSLEHPRKSEAERMTVNQNYLKLLSYGLFVTLALADWCSHKKKGEEMFKLPLLKAVTVLVKIPSEAIKVIKFSIWREQA